MRLVILVAAAFLLAACAEPAADPPDDGTPEPPPAVPSPAGPAPRPHGLTGPGCEVDCFHLAWIIGEERFEAAEGDGPQPPPRFPACPATMGFEGKESPDFVHAVRIEEGEVWHRGPVRPEQTLLAVEVREAWNHCPAAWFLTPDLLGTMTVQFGRAGPYALSWHGDVLRVGTVEVAPGEALRIEFDKPSDRGDIERFTGHFEVRNLGAWPLDALRQVRPEP